MQFHPDIKSRLMHLTTGVDAFDPWHELEFDSDTEELESEFADLCSLQPIR